MIVPSSTALTVSRGTGARLVPAVAGPDRQRMETRRPMDGAPGVVPDRRTGPGGGEPPFIEAEVLDALSEAAAMAKGHAPEDETLRQALKAYRNAASTVSMRGVLLDYAT